MQKFDPLKSPDPQSPPAPSVPDLDDSELEELTQEMPALARLRDFSRLAVEVPWFSELGAPLDDDLREMCRTYADGLGFPEAHPALIENWEDASYAAENFDWDTSAWEAEEGLRADVTIRALEQMSEEAIQIGLSYLASETESFVRDALSTAAAIWGIEDEALLHAAFGSAMQAINSAALAVACDVEEDHPFIQRFKLFENGRWPVSLAGATFNIF
ncbi:MAG: hypothetical protein P1U50_06960 [Parvibaculaceae bacterium]|jgi:hypothetical protein|nr:hypothetical protein [Parvibaculaceae bacterium]